MKEEISIYAAKIEELAKEKKNELFYNSSEEHAEIVHKALVKNASDYIEILSGNLCSEISNTSEYCRLVEEFLQKESKPSIKILFTNYSKDFLQKPIAGVLKKYPSQVKIKQYEGQINYKEQPVHFTVSDDRAFRLETDIKKRMAFGNFNSPSQAKSLHTIFNKVFESSLTKPVTLC